jgi:hypothetical protein
MWMEERIDTRINENPTNEALRTLAGSGDDSILKGGASQAPARRLLS